MNSGFSDTDGLMGNCDISSTGETLDPCSQIAQEFGFLDTSSSCNSTYYDQPQGPIGGDGGGGAAPTCEQTEEAWLTAYLGKNSPTSPLVGLVDSIVQKSDAAGIDDRFIGALAGQESGYGTKITRGPFNAWNNLAHTGRRPYSSWNDSLSGAVNLLTGSLYFGSGLTTVGGIYGRYDNSNLSTNPAYPKQLQSLTNIYVNQMGGGLIVGNPQEVDFSRCP
jgi:hypothetical protein